MVGRRRELAVRYNELFDEVPGIDVPVEPSWARTNWQTYTIRLPAGINQNRVMQAMRDGGVATRRGVMCAHREPAYRNQPWRCVEGPGGCGCPPGNCRRLPNSERLQGGSIAVPLFHTMTDGEQRSVVDTLSRGLNA